MVVYNRKMKHAEAFDYRETGPANMTIDMYNGKKNDAKVGKLYEKSNSISPSTLSIVEICSKLFVNDPSW